MSSPTQLTLRLLRQRDYVAEVVEKWNPYVKRRFDLFQFIDVLAMRSDGFLGVQTTSDVAAANMRRRIRKARNLENFGKFLEAGGAVEFHGWRKVPMGRRRVWKPKIVAYWLEAGRIQTNEPDAYAVD